MATLQRAGNMRVKKIIEDKTGLQVNQICGTLGKGGGSTDGNTGRRFYDHATLSALLSCVKDKYHSDLSMLHKNLKCFIESNFKYRTSCYWKIWKVGERH